MLAKRRNYANQGNESEDEEEYNPNANNDENQFYNKLKQDLPKMLEMIQAPDFDSQLAATVKFRQILSREHNPPIDLVIQSGVIPTLVEFMKEDHPDMLQLEAAWALTNIASVTRLRPELLLKPMPCLYLSSCCTRNHSKSKNKQSGLLVMLLVTLLTIETMF